MGRKTPKTAEVDTTIINLPGQAYYLFRNSADIDQLTWNQQPTSLTACGNVSKPGVSTECT